MKRAPLIWRLILICALALQTGAALACAFHYTKLERTAVDWLVGGDHVVLARPDPTNPFAFKVVRIIRGAEPVDAPPFLVDSVTRRKMAANPSDAVMFARDADGAWVRAAYVNSAFQPLISVVQSHAPEWSLAYTKGRFEVFEALQDHPDASLRQLALQEIDKAPYGMLRGMDLRIPGEDLIRQIWTRQGYAYQSIYVLLLGIDGSPAARREVHAFIDRVADWDWANNLGAFATALVELDGPAGIAKLDRVFLSDPDQPADKLEQVVEALAIHNGLGDLALKSRIAVALQNLAETRPDGAELIARQFLTRNDWTQAGLLETVLEERKQTAPLGLISVAVYVAQARAAGALANGG